jgi:hypothetical protein
VAANLLRLARCRRRLADAVRAGDAAAVERVLGPGDGLAGHAFADVSAELRASRLDAFLRREVRTSRNRRHEVFARS